MSRRNRQSKAVVEGIVAAIVIGGAALLYFLASATIASAIVGVAGLALGIVAFIDQLSNKREGTATRRTKVSVDVGKAVGSHIFGIDRPEGSGTGTERCRDSREGGARFGSDGNQGAQTRRYKSRLILRQTHE